MDILELQKYCHSLPATEETMPFDDDVLVFKVAEKMFCLASLVKGDRMNVKCDPDLAIELRERYPEIVLPGYHMSKKHWNTIIFNSSISDEQLIVWVKDSYDLIVSKLPKKIREEISR